MNNNKKDKIKEFFKKEGFYVVLFICLCVVAVVATIATRNSDRNKTANEPKEFSLDITENQEDKTTNTTGENAELVENKNNISENEKSTGAKSEGDEAATANAKLAETVLYFPVDGTISMGYKEGFVNEAGTLGRTSSSINIKVKNGAEVKAAGEGMVEEVVASNATKGAYVRIKHTDGRYTSYGNLDSNIAVKKGDAVTSNTVLGKVGNTAEAFAGTQYENDLIFEYYTANNEPQDPTLIFKYTKLN